MFPYDYTTKEDRFSINYSLADLQNHDQGKGIKYTFTLKAYNRAGIFQIIQSEEFTVGNNIEPDHGIIYHTTGNTSQEVSFQADQSYLCASWIGFNAAKAERELDIHLGIGNETFKDNIQPLQLMEQGDNNFCFENIWLTSLSNYYFYIVVTDNTTSTEATSKGITVANYEDVYTNAKVDDGGACKEDMNLVNNSILLPNISHPLEIDIQRNITSWMIYTVLIKMNIKECIDCISIYVNGELLSLTSWKRFNGELILYYFWEQKYSSNIMTIYNNKEEEIQVLAIGTSQCYQDIESQSSLNELKTNWNFANIHQFVSHYEVAFYEKECSHSARSCSQEFPLNDFMSSGKDLQYVYQTALSQSTVYVGHVKPCFGMQCLDPVLSNGVIVDTKGPIAGIIKAEILHVKNSLYQLTAEWEPFQQELGGGYGLVYAYDWSITVDGNGYGQLTPWKRLASNNNTDVVYVSMSRLL